MYVTYVYDELDRVVGVCYNGVKKTEFVYASNGEITNITDLANNTTYSYYYDGDGKLINERAVGASNKTEYNTFYKYGDNGEIVQRTMYFPTSSLQSASVTSYAYNEDGTLNKITSSNSEQSYSYDDFGRVQATQTKVGSTTLFFDSYTYKTVGTTSKSYVESVISSVGSDSQNTLYTYDTRGNIICIQIMDLTANASQYIYYTYDEKNQLTREDNQVLGKTYVHTYDSAGNVLNKRIYNYTRGSVDSLTPITNDIYSYSGDKLISFNGVQIQYDGAGNPLNYYGDHTAYQYTWENGRQLASMVVNGSQLVTYKYNQDGIRTEKTFNNKRQEYTLNGTQIVRECEYNNTTNKLLADKRYYYDANGIISSATVYYYGESTTCTTYNFYFKKNLQNDVVAIYNASGECLARFDYDAWGLYRSTSVSSDAQQVAVAKNCTFRYRGYYCDPEQGHYYLNSRYYNAYTHRFINADDASVLFATPNALTDKNPYAYCDNNPVMRTDENGEFWLVSVAIGLGLQYVSDVVGNVIAGESGWDILKPTSSVGEYVVAGVTSLIHGAGIGSALIRSATAEAIVSIERAIKGEENNIVESIENVVIDTAIDSGVGVVSEKVTKAIKSTNPVNYSTFAGSQYKKNPNFTSAQIKKKMQGIIKRNDIISKGFEYTIDVVSELLPF